MELRDKVDIALRRALPVQHVELEDDRGIYGMVVSKWFEGVSALNRQLEIDKILRDPSAKITALQRRRVMLIVPLTPREYKYSFARSNMGGGGL